MMRSTLVSLAILLGAACSDPANGSRDAGHGDDASLDASVSCATPPAGVCVDASTLSLSRAPGVLINGTCSFETFTSTCAFGCANGACQAQICTPSCSAATCSDDGCGGTCGPCPSGTTFPGLSSTPLGIARDVTAAPDGIHLATIRALRPSGCEIGPVGSLDVWTVPASGVASHRTISAHVLSGTAMFSDDNYLLYIDSASPCTHQDDLWVARADGTGPHLIAKDASRGFQVINGIVFFELADPRDPTPGDYDGFVYAARLPDGAPKQIAKVHSDLRSNTIWIPNPTGDAIWSRTSGDLSIHRLDGTSSPLGKSPVPIDNFPAWSPDGKKLAYAVRTLRAGNSVTALRVINTDGNGDTLLDSECDCTFGLEVARWAPDGSRLAWVEGAVNLGFDVHVHTIAGGDDVVLGGLVAPSSGNVVPRMAFSRDSARFYATVGTPQIDFTMLSAPVATSGAMTVLAPSHIGDGWVENGDGSVLAVLASDATRVITVGGATQTIAGDARGALLEHVASSPRWLIQHGPTLAVYPPSGAGAGVELPAFSTNLALDNWAFDRNIPFVYGWSDSTVLFSAAPMASSPRAATQDLMAWTTAATGRLASFVTHYRPASPTARVYFTTADDGLFWIARP